MEASDDDSSVGKDFLTPDESPNPSTREFPFRQRTEQARLQPIPTEILQLILSHSPDALTLRNLALSSPTFYRSFSAARDIILHNVLLNEYGPRVLPDALAALYSGRISPGTSETVKEFLGQHTHTTRLPTDWTMSDALELNKLHDDVEYFVRGFVSSLSSHPTTGVPSEKPLALSSFELDRIRSAFYRFEMYSNCFRQPPSPPALHPDSDQTEFLTKYSPWEIEQLATIYDYICHRISIPFNEVARHDVEWGGWNVPFYDDTAGLDNEYLEYYLQFGLDFLRRLVTAHTYDERYQMLFSENLNYSISMKFLGSTLCGHPYDDGTGLPLGDYTDEDRRTIIRPPFLSDPDKGPVEAWQWAYDRHNLPYVYFQAEQRALRKSGYVMFDSQRLRSWGMFDEPFQPCNTHDPKAFLAHQEEMRESWAKRSRLWQNGARGRYSDDGTSKLWYTRDRFERDNGGPWKFKSTPLEKVVVSLPGEPVRYRNPAN